MTDPRRATSFEEYHRERRAIAKAHHPDRGGDPEVLAAELAALDRRWGFAPPGRSRSTAARSRSDTKATSDVVFVRTSVPRRISRAVRHASQRFYRTLPGTRRYIDISGADQPTHGPDPNGPRRS